MTKFLVLTFVVGAAAFSGCAAVQENHRTYAFTEQARCDRSGGWWHDDRSFCEPIVPGSPAN